MRVTTPGHGVHEDAGTLLRSFGVEGLNAATPHPATEDVIPRFEPDSRCSRGRAQQDRVDADRFGSKPDPCGGLRCGRG